MTTKGLLRQMTLMVLLITFGVLKTMAATIFVTGPITTNVTWTNNNTYVLVGFVYVKNNATLTINSGTLIKGDSATLGTLIITRGAKMNAIGTACQPIVFTSDKPAGLRQRGDWGGIIILGYATINAPGDTAHIEGIVPNPDTRYGGGLNPNCGGGNCPDDNDNSGNLQYVRIEFAGVALSPNNEINGLTLGGVGAGTTVDHVQVSFSNDDSFEFFGGKVNCKHLIAFRGLDDDFDTDFGYSGRVQFGVSLRDPNVADVSGSKGFESDNDATGSTNLPQTKAIFTNIDVIAGGDVTSNPLYTAGAHIRRNSHLYIYNGILMGWPSGLLIDGTSSQTNVTTDTMVQNNLITCAVPSNYVTTASPSGATAVIELLQNHAGNSFYSGNAGVNLANPYNLTAPNFQPNAGSPALGTASFQHIGLNDPFFQQVTYIGAFDGTNDWTGDWANWDPVNTVYNGKINYAPVVSGTAAGIICPNSGSVNITVTGGKPPYSYQWSNGSTSEDLTGVAPGNYTVTVFDAGRNCSVVSKVFKVKQLKPQLTSCTSTSSTITVFRSGIFTGFVTGYQLRFKKHSVSNYGPWMNVGTGNSFTVTGLLSNTQYDFQIRGICTSGFTAASAPLTCSTTVQREGDKVSGNAAITAYPNPSNGSFTVELNGYSAGASVNVKVINMLGQVVYTRDNVNTDNSVLNIDLGNVPAGLYNIEVSNGTHPLIQNIMISK